MNPDELTDVYTTHDANEAEIIKGALEAEGIKAEIEGEHQAGLTGALAVRLFVRAADAQKARQIIESHQK